MSDWHQSETALFAAQERVQAALNESCPNAVVTIDPLPYPHQGHQIGIDFSSSDRDIDETRLAFRAFFLGGVATRCWDCFRDGIGSDMCDHEVVWV